MPLLYHDKKRDWLLCIPNSILTKSLFLPLGFSLPSAITAAFGYSDFRNRECFLKRRKELKVMICVPCIWFLTHLHETLALRCQKTPKLLVSLNTLYWERQTHRTLRCHNNRKRGEKAAGREETSKLVCGVLPWKSSLSHIGQCQKVIYLCGFIMVKLHV